MAMPELLLACSLNVAACCRRFEKKDEGGNCSSCSITTRLKPKYNTLTPAKIAKLVMGRYLART